MARNERPEDDFELEDDEYALGEETSTDPSPLAGSGAFTSTLLMLTGFGFVAFGASLQLAPKIAWPLVEVQQTLAAEGASPFLVAFTGFVAFCFGLVHRAARRPHVRVAPAPDPASMPDFDLLTTELAGGFHRVLETTESLGRRFGAVTQEQRQFHEVARNHFEKGGGDSDSSDAVFRLAAGLDKLHAQVDKQVGGIAEQTAAEFRSMSEALEAVGHQLQELQMVVSDLSRQAPAPAPVATPPHVAAAPVAPLFEHDPTPPATPSTSSMPTAEAPAALPTEHHDIYATQEPETPQVEHGSESAIDTDRMVQEGLEALGQLEDGLVDPHPVEHVNDNPENAEFFETVTQLSEEVQPPAPEMAQSQPTLSQPTHSDLETSQPAAQQAQPPAASTANLEEPPPALPKKSAAALEDTLEALLPDDKLRDALGG